MKPAPGTSSPTDGKALLRLYGQMTDDEAEARHLSLEGKLEDCVFETCCSAVDLRKRGKKMRKTFLDPYIGRVVSGHLAPGFLTLFTPGARLSAYSQLVIEEQHRLLQPGATIDVVSLAEDGSFSVDKYPTDIAPATDLRRIVHEGRLLTVDEQKRDLKRSQKQVAPTLRIDPPPLIDIRVWEKYAPNQQASIIAAAEKRGVTPADIIYEASTEKGKAIPPPTATKRQLRAHFRGEDRPAA